MVEDQPLIEQSERAILEEMKPIINLQLFPFDGSQGFDYDDFITGGFVRDGHIIGVRLEEGDFNPAILPILEKLEHLEALSLMENNLESLPVTIGNLRHLRRLIISEDECRGFSIPEAIGNLQDIEEIFIDALLAAIPAALGSLPKLRKLTFNKVPTTLDLPPSFASLNLKEFHGSARLREQFKAMKFKANPLQGDLIAAIKANHVEEVRALLAKGARAEYSFAGQCAPLLTLAGEHDSPEIAEALLAAGADPNGRTPEWDTALCIAADKGHPKLTQVLVDRGADPTIPDKRGESTFDLAMGAKHPEVAEILAKKAPQLDKRGEIIGRHPLLDRLFEAINNLDVGTVKGILSQEPTLVQKTREGWTPLLTLAWGQDSPEIAEAFLAAGADPNTRTPDGDTALTIAANKGRPKLAQVLLDRGADPTIPNGQGVSALDIAIGIQDLEVAILLVKHAPVLVEKLEGGWYPLLYLADLRNSPEITGAFLAAGANPNLRNSKGSTVLAHATMDAHYAVAKVLIDKGGDMVLLGKEFAKGADLQKDPDLTNRLTELKRRLLKYYIG